MSDTPLADKWRIWCEELSVVPIPANQLRKMEQCFFGGAGVVILSITEPEISDDELVERLQTMIHELRERIRITRSN